MSLDLHRTSTSWWWKIREKDTSWCVQKQSSVFCWSKKPCESKNSTCIPAYWRQFFLNSAFKMSTWYGMQSEWETTCHAERSLSACIGHFPLGNCCSTIGILLSIKSNLRIWTAFVPNTHKGNYYLLACTPGIGQLVFDGRVSFGDFFILEAGYYHWVQPWRTP